MDSVFRKTEQSPWEIPRAFVFAEVVRGGSITAAAAELGMSKSAVSAQLKELERFLGTTLIERTTRTQRLTEAGRGFLPYVHAILEAWQGGLRNVKATMQEPVGTLRITAPSYLFAAGVGRAIAAFSRHHPDVVLQAHVSDQRQTLEDGGFDLALRVADNVRNPRLFATILGEDHDIIVASPEVASGLSAVSRPEQLAATRWIAHAELSTARTFEGPDGQRVELRLPQQIIAGSGLAMRALAREGAGVAVMLRAIAREDLASGRLVQLVPEWHCGERKLYAVCRLGDEGLPKIRRFTEHLREQF